ncbi:Dipeptide-binding protein [Streptococcus thermophilus CNCM I-1630]|nr:Dipeptide-binding protein [Streptococcus thermophilus CNCM I-1630]
MASERLGVEFGIVDLSLAPTPAVGDSVARVLEAMGLEVVGTHGTTAALALLNDQVKKGGIMACNQVGGSSRPFIPGSEDEGMIAALQSGHIILPTIATPHCLSVLLGLYTISLFFSIPQIQHLLPLSAH